LEEKANALSLELSDTKTKLEEETKLKEEATEKFNTLNAEHQALLILRKGLEDKIYGLEIELRTTKEQFKAEKERLEGELGESKRTILFFSFLLLLFLFFSFLLTIYLSQLT
jgi:pilus assembly protein TadC